MKMTLWEYIGDWQTTVVKSFFLIQSFLLGFLVGLKDYNILAICVLLAVAYVLDNVIVVIAKED